MIKSSQITPSTESRLSQTSPLTETPLAAPVRDRRLPAWLMSALLHGVLLAVLVLVMRSVQPDGAGDVENRSGGIVLVDSTELATEYLTEGKLESLESPTNPAEVADSAPPISDNATRPELPGMEASDIDVSGAGESLLESLEKGAPEVESAINDSQSNADVGGVVTTEVFGIKGTGNRFVYLFDRSKSMEDFGRRPLLAARQELLQSVDSLAKTHRFQIVFYNDQTKVFNADGEPKMYFATDEIKDLAKSFVNSVNGDRSTDHFSAVKYALSLGPDVIFMLTDAEGGFTHAELVELSRYNRSATELLPLTRLTSMPHAKSATAGVFSATEDVISIKVYYKVSQAEHDALISTFIQPMRKGYSNKTFIWHIEEFQH